MRLRKRRGTGGNRKAIGAAVIVGVLVVAGATGVQFASASENSRGSAAGLVEVDGQRFDVSQCRELQIDGGTVICDGEELDPVQDMGAAEAAQLSADALEASCDVFATNLAAAQQEADQQGDSAGSTKAGKAATQATGKSAKAAVKAQRKALKDMAAQDAADGRDAAGAQDAADAADDAAAADDQALQDAQFALLEACVNLANAKTAVGSTQD
jgi:hypothetical protein